MKKIMALLLTVGLITLSGCSTKDIGEAEAKKIALEDAQVNEEEVSFTVNAKTDDEYNFVFLSDTHKYEYEIDAEDGKIEEKRIEEIKKTDTDMITQEVAKQKVLEHFGVNENDVYDYTIELENGYYDVDFKVNNMEYDADIDVKTGSILRSKKGND